MNQFGRDKKAVGMVIEYILTFAVASLLLMVLVLTSQGLLENSADIVTYESFEIIGNDIVLKISNMDRVVEATSESGDINNLNSEFSIPNKIAGRTYSISFTQNEIIMRPSGGSVEVKIPFNITTSIEPNEIYSSQWQHAILYNSSSAKIEVI